MISLINELKDEVQKLKDGGAASTYLEATDMGTLKSLTFTEQIISEIQERNKRSSNFIIYGLTENATSKREQTELDNTVVRELLDEVHIQPHIDLLRLGKFDASKSNRNRPLRVRLSSSDLVSRIIYKFKSLKFKEKYPSLNISFDRTPKQVSYYKEVRAELDRRMQEGESDLSIKYRDGIPRIVSSKN